MTLWITLIAIGTADPINQKPELSSRSAVSAWLLEQSSKQPAEHPLSISRYSATDPKGISTALLKSPSFLALANRGAPGHQLLPKVASPAQQRELLVVSNPTEDTLMRFAFINDKVVAQHTAYGRKALAPINSDPFDSSRLNSLWIRVKTELSSCERSKREDDQRGNPSTWAGFACGPDGKQRKHLEYRPAHAYPLQMLSWSAE